MTQQLLLYNTASCQKEPILQDKLGIYICGVTPYDTTHLGHAFTFVAYDVLIRYLRYLGRTVVYVQNVTDIDDDILLRAKSVGMNWRRLVDRETKKFLDDMDALGWVRPDHYVKATEHIPQMQEIIKKLISDRLKRLKGVDPKKAKARIFSYLVRRGFSTDTAADAINQL